MKPVRVAVVGVGSIGSLHAKIYAQLPQVAQLVAVCDVNQARAQEVAQQAGCAAVTDFRALIGQVEAVSLAVPTSLHHPVGVELLKAGLHVLIEKPIAASLQEADELLAAAEGRGLIVQVGHIERFNAALKTAATYLTHPRFIEAHRLSPYPLRPSTRPEQGEAASRGSLRTVPSTVEGRGTDVSVVLDVMIHDLDLVLALVRESPTSVEALGVPVLSASEDIANARVVFPSGCVANLTASRVSDETLRRIRVFQEDCYLSIDYKGQAVELARKVGLKIERQQLPVTPRPPLEEELESFLQSVRSNSHPLVSGREAREALALALRIEEAMRNSECGMRSHNKR